MSLELIKLACELRDPNLYCCLCGREFGPVLKSQEHIFPRWLQHRHRLLDKTIHIPNGTTKRCSTVKLPMCRDCNNEIFGSLEQRVSVAAGSAAGVHDGLEELDDKELAIWLGKIFFLLSRKSGMHEDFRLRNEPEKDTILPQELQRGFGFLAVFLSAYALKKGFRSCFLGDLPILANYSSPFSLYRFRIDTRSKHEAYDYLDNATTLGAAIRFGDIGIICLFDGGLHKRFSASRYAFIEENAVHPIQFSELAASMFYDQSVLIPNACNVNYYWNRILNSVIAELQISRSDNPYLQKYHDPERRLACVAHYTGMNVDAIKDAATGNVMSTLFNIDGSFFKYPSTSAEYQNLPPLVVSLAPTNKETPQPYPVPSATAENDLDRN